MLTDHWSWGAKRSVHLTIKTYQWNIARYFRSLDIWCISFSQMFQSIYCCSAASKWMSMELYISFILYQGPLCLLFTCSEVWGGQSSHISLYITVKPLHAASYCFFFFVIISWYSVVRFQSSYLKLLLLQLRMQHIYRERSRRHPVPP